MARLSLRTPSDVLRELGRRARALRLRQNLTQAELSERADVATRTLQRFEHDGRGSIELVVRVAFALGVERSLDSLFEAPKPDSIDEFLGRKSPERRRTRRLK